MVYIKKNPLVICVCGKARSGKSLVGNYLYEEYDKDKKVIISPYTKYLKMYIREILGKDFDDNDKPREMLQNISSELIKDKLGDREFFIRRELEDIDFYSYFFEVIIIPDVRFPKEIEVLKDRYERVISIGVIRDNFDNGLSFKEKNDETEISLDNYGDYDYVVDNDGSDSLYKKAMDIKIDIEKRFRV